MLANVLSRFVCKLRIGNSNEDKVLSKAPAIGTTDWPTISVTTDFGKLTPVQALTSAAFATPVLVANAAATSV